jgi:hypothetical protein
MDIGIWAAVLEVVRAGGRGSSPQENVQPLPSECRYLSGHLGQWREPRGWRGGGGMKARVYRLGLALCALGLLVAVMGAGKKW